VERSPARSVAHFSLRWILSLPLPLSLSLSLSLSPPPRLPLSLVLRSARGGASHR
jgi:hypothetical protein